MKIYVVLWKLETSEAQTAKVFTNKRKAMAYGHKVLKQYYHVAESVTVILYNANLEKMAFAWYARYCDGVSDVPYKTVERIRYRS